MTALNYVHDGTMAVITLNRPPHNRFAGELTVGLGEAIYDLDGRTDTRALLIRANGPDFSHGGNVRGWIGQSEDEFARGIAKGLALINKLQEFPFPVVTAVQWTCRGSVPLQVLV